MSSTDASAIWEPIEPLTESELAIDVSEFTSVARSWADSRAMVQQANPNALNAFYERLRRSWSIETGILENLYMLDRGTTQTLIDKGFHQELVNRADTDIDPGRLVALLKDHLIAGEMLQEIISSQRPLTRHFLWSLHALLMRHQETIESEDTLGNIVAVEPLRGRWKVSNNWRELGSGEKRFYCPPEQVNGQMEDLLSYLEIHEQDEVNTCILAAWIHQRFTLIHPFEDGNGRIARALVNYLFIKDGLFPVVVDRSEKTQYIDALESADDGNLFPLVSVLAVKQIEVIKQALSLIGTEENARQEPLIADLARGIVERVHRREAQQQQQFREVDVIITSLAQVAAEHLGAELAAFKKDLAAGGVNVVVDVDQGGSYDGREHYYRFQIIESAQEAQKWANFNEQVRWVRALARAKSSQLRVVFSFHHVGRVLNGVAEVTSIADLEDAQVTVVRGEEEGRAGQSRRLVHAMLQPFSFTWKDSPENLEQRFREWCSTSLVIGLREWSETL